MANPYFQFKQFTVYHDRCAMKVTTDSCLFGAWAANEIQHSETKIENTLDIGTGTGLLSLMIAQKSHTKINAIEIDEAASLQAIENIFASPWANQIKIFHQDILAVEQYTKHDCIISNPPFYENEIVSTRQQKNIAHHSHKLKLIQLIAIIKNKLAPGGIFFLLLPSKRRYEFKRLAERYHLFIAKEIAVRQSAYHQPFRIMFMGSTEEKEAVISEITICDEKQQYTNDFINLLKDYYLYL
jgi:tRNA1Val (adenine37-N6)-methyltransferase